MYVEFFVKFRKTTIETGHLLKVLFLNIYIEQFDYSIKTYQSIIEKIRVFRTLQNIDI